MSNLLANLNPQQTEAVTHEGGPLLVVAGAGSGKTRVIAHRIAHLITQHHVPHYAILAITFTNKAAREMKTRVAELLEGTLAPQEINEMWVSTFHSACTRILHRNISLLGYPERFSIYDAADSNNAIKSVMQDLGLDTKRLPPKIFRNQISKAKNDLLSPEQLLAQAEGRGIYNPQQTFEIYQNYQKLLWDCGAMDFDDLLVQTDVLFRDHPEVLSYYQRKFRHVLIDEYQDTNAVQNSIALRLCQGGGDLFAVGDADQSIYGFRGAKVGNIEQLEKALPNIRKILLEENYRSIQNILSSANNVIKHNRQRFKRTLRANKQPTTGDKKVIAYAALDDRQEARWITRRIHEILRDNSHLSYGDFAVLYRTNAQSALFEEALNQNEIPYQVVGSIGFFDRKAVKDAMAFIRAVANPRDVQSITRVINLPSKGIGSKTIAKLVGFASSQDISLVEALGRSDEVGVSAKARTGIEEFLELCQAAEASFEFGPEYVLEQVLEQSGYLPNLRQRMEEELEGLPISPAGAEIENIQRLLTLAGGYETVADFVDYTTLLTRVDETLDSIIGEANISGNDKNDKVSLMTMHAAKGLEFTVVFVAGLEDGVLPHRNSMEGPDGIEEERRLAYVAVTRAKEQLFLTYALVRKQYKNIEANEPSRFLQEMAGEIYGDNNDFFQFLYQETYQNSGWRDSNSGISSGEPSSQRWGTAKASGRRAIEGPTFHGQPVRRQGTAEPAGRRAPAEASLPDTSYTSPDSANGAGQPYCVNDGIEHRRWGKGVVLEVKGAGRSEEIIVDFPQVGRKHLLVAAAPISRISPD